MLITASLACCRPADEVARYCHFLTDGVLVPSDSVPALGVTYHVVDCWLPELLEAAVAVPTEALHRLLEPVAQCAARTPHPACLARLTCDTLLDPLVWSSVQSCL